MNSELINLIDKLKRNRELYSYDEAAIKQGVVLRILKVLGWDIFNVDEVYPEYSVGDGRVDYALRHNGINKVFIEVKKPTEELERFQQQLLGYSFKEGVKLAVLTNGIIWWFYLPLREGSWEQRKFYTIEIYDQTTENIADKFEDFLAKESVISDRAVKKAEELYISRHKESLVKETLPKAWQKIISEPDEILVELLAETTEKLCGYRPDNELVETFLMERVSKGAEEETVIGTSLSPSSFAEPGEYTGKVVVAFTFMGSRYTVRSWKDMLIKIIYLLLERHKEQFDKVLTLRGRKRPYFTKNPNELRSPERIKSTGIYVETNLSANQIAKLSKNLIILFGYKEKDLYIETK